MPAVQIPDIPRFNTALSEWLSCTIYVVMLRKRNTKLPLPLICAVSLAAQSVWLILTDAVPLLFWIPCMAAATFLMYLYIGSCCQLSGRDAAYFTIRAFVLAEMMASLEWQLVCYFIPDTGTHIAGQILLLVVVYGSLATAIYLMEKRQLPAKMRLDITWSELISALIIGIAIFGVSNISYVFEKTPFSARYPADILIIRTLVDIGGFAILYTHYVVGCQYRTWREVEALKSVLQKQYVQYRLSRESISLINQKYHDLKHQIQALRAENDPERKNAYLDEMEEGLKNYEAQFKTGNVVLDTILTSKALYCQKHSITFTCVVDGSLVGRMDVMDLSSVFGNALDNAIEYERRIPDKDKRLLHVTVSRQKNFVLCCFENYYEGNEDLVFEDGLPKTTKPDTDYHGYGLKSIRQVADKYAGSATVRTDNHWFELRVLLPVQNVAAENA